MSAHSNPYFRATNPFFVRFAVLALSKVLMYGFHYDVIKKQYKERAQFLFTDTDSLMYAIQTENIYEVMGPTRPPTISQDFQTIQNTIPMRTTRFMGK